MKKFAAFLVALGCFLHPLISQAVSWEDEKRNWEENARQNVNYRDPGYAARLAFSPFPIDLGHFYVGEIKKGVWTSVGEFVSVAALVIAAIDASGRSRRGVDPVWTPASAVAITVGLSGFLGLKVWSSFDAAEGAKKFNSKAGVSAQQSRLIGIGLSAPF